MLVSLLLIWCRWVSTPSRGWIDHPPSATRNPSSEAEQDDKARWLTLNTSKGISDGRQPQALVNLNGRTISVKSIRQRMDAGELTAALADSSTLYTTWPSCIDVVLERTRVLVATGHDRDAIEVIAPHLTEGAMPEVLLFGCLTSARLGNVSAGEQQYTSEQIQQYDWMSTDYLAELPQSPANTETLAWIALGCQYDSHADELDAFRFYSKALERDPSNPVVAHLLIGLDRHKQISGVERARWLAPILRRSLPRAAGQLHESIQRELTKVDYINSANG